MGRIRVSASRMKKGKKSRRGSAVVLQARKKMQERKAQRRASLLEEQFTSHNSTWRIEIAVSAKAAKAWLDQGDVSAEMVSLKSREKMVRKEKGRRAGQLDVCNAARTLSLPLPHPSLSL